jgi:hypothetical protein
MVGVEKGLTTYYVMLGKMELENGDPPVPASGAKSLQVQFARITHPGY